MAKVIQNGGFETAGSLAGDAAGWSHDSHFDGVDLGRLSLPARWPTPPEGSHVLAVGPNDLTKSYPDGLNVYTEQIVNFDNEPEYRFNWKAVTPPSFDSGMVCRLDLLVDGVSVWNKTYEAGDEDKDESGSVVLDMSAYSGSHRVGILGSHATPAMLKFGGDLFLTETFNEWPGVWFEWSENNSEFLGFDANTEHRETFNNWPGTWRTWDESGSTYMTFDGDTQSRETMDNWPL